MRSWRILSLVAAIWATCPLSAVAADGSDSLDATDGTLVVSRVGACVGEPEFAPEHDVNQDGCVTSADVHALGVNLQMIFQPLELDLASAIDVWFATERLGVNDQDVLMGASRGVIALWTSRTSTLSGS